jgi:hypothetical protein
MTNHQSQTTRNFGPASASDVLPPVQRYAPACRTENPTAPESRAISSRIQTPESNIQDPSFCIPNPVSNNPSPSRSSSPKARRGKIARLSYAIRDMVNRMLRNNIPHSKIVGALDEHNIRVTERNISNWKTRGGYRDWCTAQDRALETRLAQDNLTEHLRTTDASQLPEVGLQLAATQISQFFLQPNIQQQLTSDPDKFARTIGMLCRLTRQIHNLQKYRDGAARELGSEHDPERIKREIEQTLEITRNTYSSFIPKNAPIDPEVPHRNFIPKNGHPL